LGYLPGHKVAQAKATEAAFLVQLVDFAQSFLKGRIAVWSMKVENIDIFGLERFQAVRQPASKILGLVGVSIRKGSGTSSIGVQLCVHNETAFFPCEVSDHFLRGSAAVNAGCIDFVVAMTLE
jgi:hypothetical protein